MTIAFPSAVGHGENTVGGRGGTVYYVTTTADTWSPGSLRYGLYSLSGPRIILFKVSGYIDLSLPVGANSKDIAIVNPYVTIAGQTAPGDGICIRNGGIAIQADEVIIRHITIRPGDGTGTDPEDRDCLKIQGASNVIIDHCSFSWSIDENVSTWVHGGVYPKNITVQNCIIAEGLYDSLHPSGNHSRGLLVGDGTTKFTAIHNYFISNNRRNPLIKGATSDIQVVNNIIYNWGPDASTPGGAGTNFSDIEGSGPTGAAILNNIYGQGPNLGTSPMSVDTVDPLSEIYLSGNTGDTDDDFYIATYAYMLSAGPFTAPDLNLTATEILNDVGAKVPKLDSVDDRLINEGFTSGGALIDSPTDVGGYPALVSGTPYIDSDGDGMADQWEVNNNLTDANAYDLGNGWTNIENFINELAGDNIGLAANLSEASTVVGRGLGGQGRVPSYGMGSNVLDTSPFISINLLHPDQQAMACVLTDRITGEIFLIDRYQNGSMNLIPGGTQQNNLQYPAFPAFGEPKVDGYRIYAENGFLKHEWADDGISSMTINNPTIFRDYLYKLVYDRGIRWQKVF